MSAIRSQRRLPILRRLRGPPAQRPLHQTNPAPLKTPATSSESSPNGPSEIRSYRIDNSAAVPKSYLHFVSSETEKDDSQAAAASTPTALLNTDVRSNPADATATSEKATSTDTPQVQRIDVKPGDGGASKSPIVVVPGPGGLLVASEDPKALNEFKELLAKLQSPQIKGQRQYTVFYLRHARAAAAMGILGQVFHGTSSSGGGNSLANGLAQRALGNLGGGFGGGMLQALMAGGGGDEPLPVVSDGKGANGGVVEIYPDDRLNALFVQASAIDIDTIEQLLKVIDQPDSPEEVSITPKPRMIYVQNCEADDVATTVKNVYANRLEGGQGQQQQFNPADLFQAATGGPRRARRTRWRPQRRCRFGAGENDSERR